MVAVGDLDKVWLAVPEAAEQAALKEAFQGYFGAEWTEVLDAAEMSFAYNAANRAYFAVRNLRPVKSLTMDHLLEKSRFSQSLNIVIS